jgi:type II secretory pathway component GspD/PulD (secretin)
MIRTSHYLTLLLCLSIEILNSPSTSGQTEAGSQVQKGNTRKVTSVVEIEARLNQPCAFDFNEVPMEKFIPELEKVLGCNVQVDTSLGENPFGSTELVTCQVSNVRLRTALKLVIEEHNATYVISDGLVKIVSAADAEDPQFFRRKIFDCRELLELIAQNETRFPHETIMSFAPGGFGNGNRKTGGVFNQLPGTNPTPNRQERELAQDADGSDSATDEQLLVFARRQASGILQDLVKQTVYPASWSDSNGDFESKMVAGLLIVSASEDCLFEIQSLLTDMTQTLSQ